MISNWRRNLVLTVGTGVLISASLVYLLLTFTILRLNPLPMKIIFISYSVIWLEILLIMILVQGKPDLHQLEMGEAHHLSLSGVCTSFINMQKKKTTDLHMHYLTWSRQVQSLSNEDNMNMISLSYGIREWLVLPLQCQVRRAFFRSM